MATLSTGHSFFTKNNTTTSSNQELRRRSRYCPRFLVLIACQSQKPEDKSSTPKTRKENKKLFSQIFSGVDKFGKSLKDMLSPKQKGDWKDLVLMSLSFAVYVYISQQIVCAYFAWTSMPQQSW
ncbi:hypothetical protein Ddye_031822 [Dipteronia dyeriana]|uniref:Uncharacterized protein n=1 Tax=Dipteronia dyeriana TaxID=168575 RepID=A0AAD9TK92_9ROSI|nr:hypothetical protein Ddye_031822 [Dipteronia dyeriana]